MCNSIVNQVHPSSFLQDLQARMKDLGEALQVTSQEEKVATKPGSTNLVGRSSCVSPDSAREQQEGGELHFMVQHHYKDHANDSPLLYPLPTAIRGGVSVPFPTKLHKFLDEIEKQGLSHVVGWQPHGRCFMIRKPKQFKELLHIHFKADKISSFQRQLNLYGFERITQGRDRGSYYHELFLKGRAYLARNMPRIKIKGTGQRARSNPEQEPDFWSMPWVENANTDTALLPSRTPVQSSRLVSDSEDPSDETDSVCSFEDMHFHCVDSNPSEEALHEMLVDFELPNDLALEDDAVFGAFLDTIVVGI